MNRKNVHVARSQEVQDAIVVGSGISGRFAAKELIEGGLNVLLSERGRDLKHGSGYITEYLNSWEFPARNSKGSRGHRERYAVQSRTYAFGEQTEHFL